MSLRSPQHHLELSVSGVVDLKEHILFDISELHPIQIFCSYFLTLSAPPSHCHLLDPTTILSQSLTSSRKKTFNLALTVVLGWWIAFNGHSCMTKILNIQFAFLEKILFPPLKPVHANPTWMGCFMRNTKICEGLYFAGVPVWLVHDEEFIPLTMNIIHPVQLMFPDNIVRVMYSKRGVSKPFPSIFHGLGGLLHHYHTHQLYEGTLAEQPEPTAPPSTSQSSSSQQPSCGDKQTTQKQNRATRVKASVGPSQVPSLQKSAGGEAKWEEPDLLDIPKPHTLFDSAWRKAEKSMQRVQAGQVDPGYHFLKLTLFVNVSTPEWKKTYLFNWVSAHPLWISQIGVHSPSKFPSPQMWRDFLNGIDTDQPSSMRSASMKLAVWDILGENIIHAVQGFTGASEEIEWKGMQGLLYSIFPDESGLLMWLEPLPQESHELGLCASSMELALPYWNSFCKLLSGWPGAPPCLWFPAKLDGPSGNSTFFEHAMSASLFYIQTEFDFLG
ncbi:hypothetical protein EV401DRAFT_1889041 [Pisolithus croceorrhizus]|nr:hypothetical protein EV401DRAFT_1889041 [Pisolithus croceorrhizus]